VSNGRADLTWPICEAHYDPYLDPLTPTYKWHEPFVEWTARPKRVAGAWSDSWPLSDKVFTRCRASGPGLTRVKILISKLSQVNRMKQHKGLVRVMRVGMLRSLLSKEDTWRTIAVSGDVENPRHQPLQPCVVSFIRSQIYVMAFLGNVGRHRRPRNALLLCNRYYFAPHANNAPTIAIILREHQCLTCPRTLAGSCTRRRSATWLDCAAQALIPYPTHACNLDRSVML
jgi:hypothetical protein